MRFSREQIDAIAAEAPKLARGIRRRSLARSVQTLRTRLAREINTHMQGWMVLLDESVQFLIYFEQYQLKRELTAATSTFALQISKLRSTCLSIRELVALGQEAPAAALARIFIEDIEIAMALADDPEFALAYCDTEDHSDFWKRHIAYGRLAPRVTSFLMRAGRSSSQVSEYLESHKLAKNSLSAHVHTANHSAFRSGAVPSLTHPGMIALGALGALSAHFPGLCLLVADETHSFAAACINIFVKPDPPAAFANYAPSKNLGAAIVSAHVLQHLIVEHGEDLWSRCDAFFGDDSPDAV